MVRCRRAGNLASATAKGLILDEVDWSSKRKKGCNHGNFL